MTMEGKAGEQLSGRCGLEKFPFKPYDSQKKFVRTMFELLSDGKVGILESPTGTGKSLGIACAAIQWVRCRRASNEKEKASVDVAEGELDWIASFMQKRATERSEHTNSLKKKREKRLGKLRKQRKVERKAPSMDEFLLEEVGERGKGAGGTESAMASDSDLSSSSDNGRDSEEEEIEDECKVIYCSRTHSQLAQFTQEIRKTTFKHVKVCSLGSRQTMCINPKVRNLPSAELINEACIDLCRSNSAAPVAEDGKRKRNNGQKRGCAYREKRSQVNFKDRILTQVMDVEECVAEGTYRSTCPYYASRAAIKQAEVVTVPYTSLLQAHTREALGLSLKGNIVVIDEAHNLVDAIHSVHSSLLTKDQVTKAMAQLNLYLDKYRSRLSHTNFSSISQILFVGKAIIKGIDRQTSKSEGGIMDINTFTFTFQIDNINMFKLTDYIRESHIIQKVSGFAASVECSVDGEEVKEANTSAFHRLAAFIQALTSSNADGRILLSYSPTPSVKFLVLNSHNYFSDIIEEAHSVILAGGTMTPIDDMIHQLFPRHLHNDIAFHGFDHVIPPTNVLPMVLSKGPAGGEFDFSFSNRESSKMLAEFGAVLSNICNVVPGGVVVFFSSYAYCGHVLKEWTSNGMINRITKKKKLFEEPQTSRDVDRVLTEFRKHIEAHTSSGLQTGAILFSVVGGKMSEGINFNDDLARCVIMAGVPFPNPTDLELQERAKFAERDSKVSKSEFLESLTMRAVNQSIGRSIRHANDYASIILLDRRYKKPSLSSKLPRWIQSQKFNADTFGQSFSSIRAFFQSRKAG